MGYDSVRLKTKLIFPIQSENHAYGMKMLLELINRELEAYKIYEEKEILGEKRRKVREKSKTVQIKDLRDEIDGYEAEISDCRKELSKLEAEPDDEPDDETTETTTKKGGKILIVCGCGSTFSKDGKAKHERTLKHIKFVEDQEESEDEPEDATVPLTKKLITSLMEP
jgi:hypothetical protein